VILDAEVSSSEVSGTASHIMGVIIPTRRYTEAKTYARICVTVNCACKNFASPVAVRVLLGCFESAVAPALILVTGMGTRNTSNLFESAFDT
jgi:hypothetical protein